MILADTRIYGETRYILADEGESSPMLIPDEMRKCVVYLGYRMADGSYWTAGTAFWLCRPFAEDIPRNFAYLVTAKHVLKFIEDKGIDKVQLRVNLRNGTLKWHETDLGKWERHDSADVAALKIGIDSAWDHKGWLLIGLATDTVIETNQIGIGDEVFVVGMFSRRLGNKKNIPIVRMGNIAAMPVLDEPVRTKLGPMNAYLVEARSIGGISGSPVFVDIYGALRRSPGFVPVDEGLTFAMIGLMHGHFDVKSKQDADDDSADDTVDDGLEKIKLNMGIAIVVPSERIFEVLDKFSKQDEKELKTERDKDLPAMDAEDIPEIPFTRTDFESALKKASRKK